MRQPNGDGDLQLHPHPGQRRVWDAEQRFVFMLAGTQGGKTSFGPLWLWREIQRRGAGDYLAVTSTHPLMKLKMLPEFLRLFAWTLNLGAWRGSDRVFEFSPAGAQRTYGTQEPTRVIFGSATNSNALESATAKAAWLDEVGQDDFRLESWEAILRRLSLNQGRVLGTTTPYNLGWFKQLVYDPWRAGDRPDVTIIQFESIANPVFPTAEYERARRELPAWKFRLFYGAEFVRPAGLIYSDFIDAYREQGGHKVRPFDLPPAWPRSVGLDFGAVNTATVWLARDPDADVVYLYRETHDGGKTTAMHAADVLAASTGVNLVGVHGGARSEDQQRMDWRDAGVWVQAPAVADVEAGIDRVVALFKTQRLYVFDTCAGVLDELGRYSRELDELQQPTEKIKDKETFHRLDALRYVAQGLDTPPAADAGRDREPTFARPSRRLFAR
ncbi:MAG: hypothetical protein VW405_10075 [Rhodospirillaceae bacterium]